jgi:hypothetical protein
MRQEIPIVGQQAQQVINIPMINCGFFVVSVLEIAWIEKTSHDLYKIILRSGYERDLVLEECEPILSFFGLLNNLESIAESIQRQA